MFEDLTELVTEETLAEYERFIATHPKGHFMQSSLWGKQKPDWSWAAILRRDEGGEPIGSLSVLVRKIPGLPYTLMYGCRGPVCDPQDRETVLDLLEGANHLARQFRSYCIKLDPDLPAEDESFQAILRERGYRRLDEGKNFEGAQPRFVFRLRLQGRTEEALMASFSSKTRYNIRVAQRKGVEVRLSNLSGIEEFSALMLETGIRDGFVTRPKQYFIHLLNNLGEHARLYMAYHEGRAIAGTLAIHFGDKVWYLYGASSNASRNLMPNYLLQWEMIRWAAELGCAIYDFRGVSGDLSEDNPLYGLYRFKKGFNGDFCEFIGEYDLVRNPLIYHAADLGRKGMNQLMTVRYRLKNRQQEGEEGPHEEDGHRGGESPQ